VQAIAVLARAHQDAIWARSKARHQLRSLLREFFPTFLAIFTDRFTMGIAEPGGPRGAGDRPQARRGCEAVGEPHRRGVATRGP
jgi:hypothetical protein